MGRFQRLRLGALLTISVLVLLPREAQLSGSTLAQIDAGTFRLVADTRLFIHFRSSEDERHHHDQARKELERGLQVLLPAVKQAVDKLAAAHPKDLVFQPLSDEMGEVHEATEQDIMDSETGPVRFRVQLSGLSGIQGVPGAVVSVDLGLKRLPKKSVREEVARQLKAAAKKPRPAQPAPITPEPVQQQDMRGTISNLIHPGDPVEQVQLAGYENPQDAARYVADGFMVGKVKPIFRQILKRGQHLRFEGAPYVVFSYLGQDGKRTLQSITRCHGDLRLTFGSCGLQFLLGVNTGGG